MFKPSSLRPAGSSPCVGLPPEGSTFNVRDQPVDPEQGIYHGFYRLGMWICITDRDVWKKNESGNVDSKSRMTAGYSLGNRKYDLVCTFLALL